MKWIMKQFEIFLLALALVSSSANAMNYNVGRQEPESFAGQLARRGLWAAGGFAAGYAAGNKMPMSRTAGEQALRDRLEENEGKLEEAKGNLVDGALYVTRLEGEIKGWELTLENLKLQHSQEIERLERKILDGQLDRNKSYEVQESMRDGAVRSAEERKDELHRQELRVLESRIESLELEVEHNVSLLNGRDEAHADIDARLAAYRTAWPIILRKKAGRQKARKYFDTRFKEWQRDHRTRDGEQPDLRSFEESVFDDLFAQKFWEEVVRENTVSQLEAGKKKGKKGKKGKKESTGFYEGDSDVGEDFADEESDGEGGSVSS